MKRTEEEVTLFHLSMLAWLDRYEKDIIKSSCFLDMCMFGGAVIIIACAAATPLVPLAQHTTLFWCIALGVVLAVLIPLLSLCIPRGRVIQYKCAQIKALRARIQEQYPNVHRTYLEVRTQ